VVGDVRKQATNRRVRADVRAALADRPVCLLGPRPQSLTLVAFASTDLAAAMDTETPSPQQNAR
jgi:hypothetical protein